MKPFLILVASSFVLAFGSGCMKIQPDSIEPITNTFTSIEDSLSSNLDSGNSIENTPIYNINELTAGFIKPIKKDNKLTFIDKFIDAIRYEIARSSEVAYQSLSVRDMSTMFMIPNKDELLTFI